MEVLCYNGLRFEFIKVCMGTQRFCWKSQFCLYFVNKIYLPCCCVVFLLFASSSGRSNTFWRVIVRWVSTAKRKTRLHTDFRSAHCSKQINPLKITLQLNSSVESKKRSWRSIWVCLLHNSVHNAFATIHLFRDCFALNFKYRLVQHKWDILMVCIVHYSPDQGYSATICQRANQHAPRVPSRFICQTPRGALFPSTNRNEV